jgi:hypothetical protein
MSDFTLVQSDTSPSISGALTESDGTTPLVLTGCTVRFQMRPASDRRYSVDAAAAIVSDTGGTVRYDFVTGDLATAGEFIARWQITFPDTSVQHSEPENTITIDPA